jgi:hypothetical protein
MGNRIYKQAYLLLIVFTSYGLVAPYFARERSREGYVYDSEIIIRRQTDGLKPSGEKLCVDGFTYSLIASRFWPMVGVAISIGYVGMAFIANRTKAPSRRGEAM